MHVGGKMGSCVPPAPPPAPSPCLYPRPPCPGPLLQPWHSTQPCSCPSSRAPADPAPCSPSLLPSPSVQWTWARLGIPRSPLVGMLLQMSPRQWVGWIGTGMRGTQPIGWPREQAGFLGGTMSPCPGHTGGWPVMRVHATGCPPRLGTRVAKPARSCPSAGTWSSQQPPAKAPWQRAQGPAPGPTPLLHPLQQASSPGGPQPSWGAEGPSPGHPVPPLLQQVPGL